MVLHLDIEMLKVRALYPGLHHSQMEAFNTGL